MNMLLKIVAAGILAGLLASAAVADPSPGRALVGDSGEEAAGSLWLRPAPEVWPAELSPIPVQGCCKVCRAGKACGDTCIARNKTCRVGPGCACDG